MSSQLPLRAPAQRQRGAGFTSHRNVVSQSSLTLCALALAFTLSIATSQTADAPAFGVLLQQSLVWAPILLEQQANAEAVCLDAAQSRKWFNPKIGALSEDLNTSSNGDQSLRQIIFFISRPLELGGKRASRVAVPDRDSDVTEAGHCEAEVLWTAKLAIAYGTVEVAQGR